MQVDRKTFAILVVDQGQLMLTFVVRLVYSLLFFTKKRIGYMYVYMSEALYFLLKTDRLYILTKNGGAVDCA